MKTNTSHPKSVRAMDKRRWHALALAGALCTLPLQAIGAVSGTDIADVPLASASTTVVKPNILFTLDDSGSMGWGFMPDSIDGWVGFAGYKNHLCNSVYYNPDIRYVAPKNSVGTDFANASFTGALYDGFIPTATRPTGGTTTHDLTSDYIAYDSETSRNNGTDSVQPAYYFKWNGAAAPTSAQCQTTATGTTFPQTVGTAPNTFTKIRVSATSGPGVTDERENFANWYTYYRTRMLMMKSATGRAFVGISSGYRVGFITINPNNPVTSSKYLAITDFDTTQKANWFTKLYSQTTNGSTPLREALSRAGRHYAGIQTGINSGMTGDPMQYSCQQNFTILTTDGYWNSDPGGRDLSNTLMNSANYDGNISTTPRPLYDGAIATTNTVTVFEDYEYRDCSSGRKRVRLTTTTTSTQISPPGPTTTTTNGPNNFTGCAKDPFPTLPPDTTTTSTVASTSGGSTGSLADVAAYYYNTDLRGPGSLGTEIVPGDPSSRLDVGTENNVPAGGTQVEDDSARHQHMTTFTMGLGLAGTLNYQPDYKTTGSGDFAALRSGALNWPAPSQNNPTALDDLWHAAVNGKGQFFSAANPDTVVSSLSAALAGVNARVASAAAAATSNLEPVAGDNFAYTASYKTLDWTGELEAKEIDLTTGVVGTTPVWSAQAKLTTATSADCDDRDIRLFRSGATDNLVPFTWNTNLNCASPTLDAGTLDATEKGFFSATQVALLAQSTDAGTTAAQRTAMEGANLVNYLRGQRGFEGFAPGDLTALYRTRTGVLGDIVNAQPVFVKTPFAEYNVGLSDYAAFKTANASRTPMVYVAANDGMLHAFFAGLNISDPNGGKERWAFIPTTALPKLHKLASTDWSTQHKFFVDGTPAVGDICAGIAAETAGCVWKTILVGGLNAGGKGYYALDITDPANPKGLWEFKHTTTCAGTPAGQSSDCNLGLSFGNPQITKITVAGVKKWVVLVTSGYNNADPSAPVAGDGVGFLYVLDANDGTIIYKIEARDGATTVGDATTPSGLGKINNFVLDTIRDNTTEYVIAVDLLGNVWRFEVNATQSATRMITLVDDTTPTPVPQPITTKPELAEFGQPPQPYVFVATGKYLGSTDLSSTQKQTVWGIKDNGPGTYPVATPRTSMSQLSITGGDTRSISCLTNCSVNAGWYADLPISGERVNIDMKLQLGTLVVASNIPENNACNIGGFSFLNFFDARDGLQVAGSAYFSKKLSDSLAVGINVVRLPDGRTVVIATTSDASQQTQEAPIPPGDPQGRRTSWRELVQ